MEENHTVKRNNEEFSANYWDIIAENNSNQTYLSDQAISLNEP